MGNGRDTDRRFLVAQAQGMVSAQADCSMTEALALMQEHADSTRSTLEEIAESVVTRTVRFGR